MLNVLIYWRDYKQNWVRQLIPGRPTYWHSSAKVISKLSADDQLWMVSSGDNLRLDPKPAGFLVDIWTVGEVVNNPDDDPAYPIEDYKWRVIVNGTAEFSEPIPVDQIVRPLGKDEALHIGKLLQGPRKLDNTKVQQLIRAIEA